MEQKQNPYAAPRSAVDDIAPDHRRPVLVWAITIFMGIGIVGGVISTLALLSGNPIGGAEVAAQTSYLRPIDHVVALVATAISAVGVVQLFRLKRGALPWLAAAFVVTVAMVSGSLALRPEYRAILDQGGIWMLVPSWLINVAILGYVWRLRSKGVLK